MALSVPSSTAATIATIVTLSFSAGYITSSYHFHLQHKKKKNRDNDKESDENETITEPISSIASASVSSSSLCECGFDLSLCTTPLHVSRHRAGKQHQRNLEKGQQFCPILVTAKVNEYRAAIVNDAYVSSGDVVLEVGCAEGVTTQKLAHAVGRKGIAIGIDQRENLIQKGRARFTEQQPNLHLYAADAFDKQALIRIVTEVLNKDMNENGIEEYQSRRRTLRNQQHHGGKVDKIWLDISGSRKLPAVLDAIQTLEALFRPRLMVVKSDQLKDLVRRTHLPGSGSALASKTAATCILMPAVL